MLNILIRAGVVVLELHRCVGTHDYNREYFSKQTFFLCYDELWVFFEELQNGYEVF